MIPLWLLAAPAIVQGSSGSMCVGPKEPPGLTQPHKLALFGFMSKLRITSGPNYAPRIESASFKQTTSPGWFYMAELKRQPAAHYLKRVLTKAEGWNLVFPDLHSPYDCHADHFKNGKVDWCFELGRYGDIAIWNPASGKTIDLPGEIQPPDLTAPDKIALFKFLQNMDIEGKPHFVRMQEVKDHKWVPSSPSWYYKTRLRYKEAFRKLNSMLKQNPEWLLVFPEQNENGASWTHYTTNDLENSDWDMSLTRDGFVEIDYWPRGVRARAEAAS